MGNIRRSSGIIKFRITVVDYKCHPYIGIFYIEDQLELNSQYGDGKPILRWESIWRWKTE